MSMKTAVLTLLASTLVIVNAQTPQPNVEETTVTRSPIEVVQAVLANPTDLGAVSELVTADMTYVSLNYDNPELKRVLPYTGTTRGPEAVVYVFTKVGEYWETENFEVREIFSSGENVAVFGSFTYRSRNLDKVVTSPFSILAKVANGKLTYMQFMEDTFGTTETFRTQGVWQFRLPDGREVEAGDTLSTEDEN